MIFIKNWQQKYSKLSGWKGRTNINFGGKLSGFSKSKTLRWAAFAMPLFRSDNLQLVKFNKPNQQKPQGCTLRLSLRIEIQIQK
jgi:hypothetical protein